MKLYLAPKLNHLNYTRQIHILKIKKLREKEELYIQQSSLPTIKAAVWCQKRQILFSVSCKRLTLNVFKENIQKRLIGNTTTCKSIENNEIIFRKSTKNRCIKFCFWLFTRKLQSFGSVRIEPQTQCRIANGQLLYR